MEFFYRCDYCNKFMAYGSGVAVWTTYRDSSPYVKDPHVDFPVVAYAHRECAVEGKYPLAKEKPATGEEA